MNVMSEEELLKVQLDELRREHRELDDEIADLDGGRATDQLLIRRLKKRKLVLKDQLEDAFGAQCEVESSLSGQEALDLVSGLDPESESLAVVIADQIMPGMTGTELLERLRSGEADAQDVSLARLVQILLQVSQAVADGDGLA